MNKLLGITSPPVVHTYANTPQNNDPRLTDMAKYVDTLARKMLYDENFFEDISIPEDINVVLLAAASHPNILTDQYLLVEDKDGKAVTAFFPNKESPWDKNPQQLQNSDTKQVVIRVNVNQYAAKVKGAFITIEGKDAFCKALLTAVHQSCDVTDEEAKGLRIKLAEFMQEKSHDLGVLLLSRDYASFSDMPVHITENIFGHLSAAKDFQNSFQAFANSSSNHKSAIIKQFEKKWTPQQWLDVINEGDLKTINFCIKNKNIDINMLIGNTNDSKTALMYAAEKGDVAMVEALLAVPGIEVNRQDNSGKTALMYAAEKGDVAMVEALLAVPGIRVNMRDRSGKTALMYAASKGGVATVEILLAVADIEVNEGDNFDKTALMYAASKGDVATVKALLAVAGIEVNEWDNVDKTALMYAASKGDVAMVEALVAVPGIEVNRRYNSGKTALMYAAEKGDVATVKALLAVPGIEINTRTCFGETALMHVANKGDVAMVEVLLAVAGIEVNERDNSGKTALTYAICKGDVATVKALLAVAGIEVNTQDRFGKTAFMYAVSKGDVAKSKALQTVRLVRGEI